MFGLGSSAQLGIGIAVKLQNQFSSEAQRVSAQLRQLKKDTDSVLTSAATAARDRYAMLSAGAFMLSRGMIGAAREGAKLEHRINQISIISGIGGEKLKSLGQGLSNEFAQTLNESYSALFENTKAGINQGLGLITRYQVAVSKATDEMLGGEEGVAKGLISIMNSMQMPVSEFPRIANAVTAAANASQSSVRSLNESMKYSAHTFHQFNVPLEDALALLARLSQAGIEGSSAGTAMQNMFTHLSTSIGTFASKKQRKALQMLGLSPEDFKDAQGNMKPVMDMVRMVEMASKDMNNINRKEVLSALFNVRGQRGLVNLFGDFDPSKTMESMRGQILKGVQSDVAITQARQMTNDLASDFIRLGVSTEELKQDFSKAAEPVLRFGLFIATKFMKALSWFTGTGLGKVLTGLVVVITPLLGVLFLFRAATLTAALALRAMSMSVGYGGLMRGLMGNMGAPPVMQNAAGRWIVKGGSTFNYGGKMYKGGQLLPGSFSGGGFGAGGMIGSMVGSFFGAGGGGLMSFGAKRAVLSSLGGIGGTLLRIAGPIATFIPYLGPIALGIMGLTTLISLMNKEREPMTAENKAYLDFIDREVYNKREYNPQQGTKMEQVLQQQINVNIDGQKAFDQKFNSAMDKSIQDVGINFTH